MHLRYTAKPSRDPLTALPVRSHRRCVRTAARNAAPAEALECALNWRLHCVSFVFGRVPDPVRVCSKKELRLCSSCRRKKRVRPPHAAVSPSVRFARCSSPTIFFFYFLFRAHCMVVSPLSKRQKPRVLLHLSSESSAPLTHRLMLGSVMSALTECVPLLCDRTNRTAAGLQF